ncbi:hypothetical protein B0H16DRAFT_1569076 [Mycena metata]|uniref:MYND-type domain-containing protein n=1 Tax=Mycena metata TaxID=1033252 RepID=A0AAD7IB73_9AGAR|nr:hypothetical protein B0H16DRAFT_1569076 [Mycena metata]
MHPALRLSVLDALPYTLKRTALAAARGSEEDLCEIHQRLIADTQFNDDGEKFRLFLPIFYANLDRAKIPIGDGRDDPSIFTAGPVHSAMISLHHICTMTLFIPLPSDIFSDLWPKLWKWVEFLDAYRFTDDKTGPDGIAFVKFVSMFLPDKIARGILTSTPGVRCMIAKSWMLLFKTSSSSPVVGYGFDALTMILHSPAVVASRADAEEFIEGAGGGLEDLASLVVGYVDRIAQENFGLDGEIFNFIHNVETALGPQASNGMMLGPLYTALGAADIVRSLIQMIDSLMRKNASAYATHIPPLIAKAVHFLLMLFVTSGPHLIPDALRAGLLYVVISCSRVNQCTRDLTTLVEEVLTSSLVSYATLSVLEDSLGTVQEISKSPKFLSSTVFKHWKTFIELSDERLAFLREFNEGEQKRRKVCDNVQCGKIGDRSLFKRCSSCKSYYYCSPKCQKTDWLAGEHRNFCQSYPSFRLSELQPIPVRERTFMRALLNHEYRKIAIDMYTNQVAFMAQSPSSPFFTLFQFDRGRVQIEVQPLTISRLRVLWSDRADQRLGGLRNDLLRAARSAHRVDVHVLAMTEGLKERFFLVPLRLQTSFVYDTLARISKQPGVHKMQFEDLAQTISRELGVDDEQHLGIH